VNFGIVYKRLDISNSVMGRFILLFLLVFSLLITPSFAKGHGGGHGGHGGGHGGGRGVGHSGGGHVGGGLSGGSRMGSNNGIRSAGKSAASRTTAGGISRGGYKRSVPPYLVGRTHSGTTLSNPRYDTYAHWSSLPYYYYGYPSMYYYDPYFSMWSLGAGLAYSPHYNYPPPADNSGYSNMTNMDGFVVFEYDTLRGNISLKNSAVFLETADSAHNYDYKLKMKDHGLTYVAIYNDDNKELNLVRLKQDNKKLWRIVHEGKLNVYDERRGFIYSPEDVDMGTLMVVYNGEMTRLSGKSKETIKQRLTAFVNKAYDSDLDPKKFTWNELLLYVDKLD
jgi:hypothetical protein